VNEYSDWKVAWHLDRVAELRASGQTTPPHVQLILSDLCNHDCPWCAYRMEGYSSNQHFGEARPDGSMNHNPARFIPYAKALEILDDCAALGVRAVEFTGGGEPTVHPQHLQIFAHALDLGLRCALVSNGNLLRPGWEDLLPRFDWVRFSLDAGTAETYARIRRVCESAFDRFQANARSLAGELARQSADTLFGISFIVLHENWPEIVLAADLARRLGAGSIRFGALFSPALADYYDADLLASIRALIEQARHLNEGPGFRVIDLFDQRMLDLEQGRPDYRTCLYQQMNVYIGGDLNVYRCCNTAYNDLGLVGSLKEQRFREFWQSDAKRQAYRRFDARACQHCAFNGKNRLLNYLAGTPVHVEFA